MAQSGFAARRNDILADQILWVRDGTLMAKIQDAILEQFFNELEKTEGFSKERVDQLRQLFTASKRPKAADLVKVFCDAQEGQLE